MVAHSAAKTPGERYGVSVMLMPIRTFSVRAASQGSSGQPWNHLPSRRDRQLRRELLHHPEGVLQLAAVGGLRDDDPVERPDGVEVELLGQVGQVRELLDGHVVAEGGQVEGELHRAASSERRVGGVGGAIDGVAGSGLLCDVPNSLACGAPARARQLMVSSTLRLESAQPLAQLALEDLAVVVRRQGVHEAVVLRPLEPGDAVEAGPVELLDAAARLPSGDDEGDDRLAPLRVGPADDGDRLDAAGGCSSASSTSRG